MSLRHAVPIGWFEMSSLMLLACRPKYTPRPNATSPAAPTPSPAYSSLLLGGSPPPLPSPPTAGGAADPEPAPTSGGGGGGGAAFGLHTSLSSTALPSWICSVFACAVAYG